MELLTRYRRWPTWLWANYEMVPLIQWLASYNKVAENSEKIAFYGLDLFNITGAADDLFNHIQPADTAMRSAVRHFKDCFSSFAVDEQRYQSNIREPNGNCAVEAENVNEIAVSRFSDQLPNQSAMVMRQDACIIVDGERYLRTRGNAADAWNLREMHMQETINRLLQFYGQSAKLIIWAHNSHAGASRFGSMNWAGKTSLANLLKYQYGTGDVFITGFGFFTGSFIAAEQWNGASKKNGSRPGR